MLVFVGLGFSPKHLTLEALSYIAKCDKVIIDTYTGLLEEDYIDAIKPLLNGKEVVFAKRMDLEGYAIEKLVDEAMSRDIAILVPGDPFIATTHDAIRTEAGRRGVETKVINGLSIINLAITRCGLQVYRFGKVVTIVFPEVTKPYSVIETIYDNLNRRLHTLILLDIRVEEKRFMGIGEAVELLLEMDNENRLINTIGIGLARLGFRDEYVVADLVSSLRKYDFPKPPYSIIVLSEPHPIELDCLLYYCNLPLDLYLKLSSKHCRSI